MGLTRKDEDPEDCSANLHNITWFRELPWRWLDNSIYDYKKEPTWVGHNPARGALCGTYRVEKKEWHTATCGHSKNCLCQISKITKDDQTHEMTSHSSVSETTTDDLIQSITTESLDMLSQTATEKTGGDQNTDQHITSSKHIV